MKVTLTYELDRLFYEQSLLREMDDNCLDCSSEIQNEEGMSSTEREMLHNLLNDYKNQTERLLAAVKERDELIESMSKRMEYLEGKMSRLEQLEELQQIHTKNRFVSTSKKGVALKEDKAKGRDEEKDDNDGSTPTVIENVSADMESSSNTNIQSQSREYRRGVKHSRMNASEEIVHECDLSNIPEGYKLSHYVERYEFDRIVKTVKHTYRIAVLKGSDGSMMNYFRPLDSQLPSQPRANTFPGTHATSNLLTDIAIDKFQHHNPAYREVIRLMTEDMRVSRQTLCNWLNKGSEYLKYLLPALKSPLLKDGSMLNSDETWCRTRVKDVDTGLERYSYKKQYMWVILNEAAKICYFLYDNGSRARKVIENFLGGFTGSVQSDAYDAYYYMDAPDSKITHIGCMAHVRNRYKDAQVGNNCCEATLFLSMIAELYGIESKCKNLNLLPASIKKVRKKEALPILGKMRALAEKLKEEPHLSPALLSAINYMLNHWKPLTMYVEDGRYSIDNSAAERAIRPLTVGRKNYISFGSSEGAETATIYYTIIETCKMRGLSPRKCLKDFFTMITHGRRDYSQMALELGLA